MAEQPLPRIPSVTQIDADLQETLTKTLADPNGRPLNIFLTLAQHPRLLKRFNVFAGTFLTHGTMSARDRELVVLRTAWRCQAVYEWGQHVLIARDAGVTDAEIVRATENALDSWSDRDRTLLMFTDELLQNVDVSEHTWSRASEIFGKAELVELTMLIGLYRMVAGFLNTMRVSPEDYLPGWPDGRGLPRD